LDTSEPVKIISLVMVPLHLTRLVIVFTVTNGFTVILNITGVPEQEFEMGITVNLPVIGILLILADTNEIGVPIPEALHPMPTLSFDQLKLVFATEDPIKAMLLATPAQITLSEI
jgi:hypothetical protein